MKPAAVGLDFRQRPGVAARPFFAAVLVVSLLAAAWVGERTWREANDLADARSRLERSNPRSTGPKPRAERSAPDADTLAAIKRAAAVADQLEVPWDELFAALEAADARPLGLLGVAPNARDRSLRVNGEARTTAELLGYVERLAAQPALTQVHLVGYNTALRDGIPVVAFSLAASWRPRP